MIQNDQFSEWSIFTDLKKKSTIVWILIKSLVP